MKNEPGRDDLCELAIEQFFRTNANPDEITAKVFLKANEDLEPEISEKFHCWLSLRNHLGLEPSLQQMQYDTELVASHLETNPADCIWPTQGNSLAGERYRLIERLGKGQFGTVWKAHDSVVDRNVAIKILRNDLLADELRQFQNDLVVGRLRHEHIVRVFDVGESGSILYIVSELIEGDTLRQWIKHHSRSLSPRRSCLIARQLADALHYAHVHQVIHRDIKPENIMLHAGTDRPCLVDFGLALMADNLNYNTSPSVVGTIPYMAPEQARGESQAADARTDIYAMGVVFYEMLAGERPFRGRPDAILRQILENSPPAPRRFQQDIPSHLVQICLKCLEKLPDDRFQSAAQLRDEITRFLDNKPPGPGIQISRSEHFHRWIRRYPIATASLVSLLAALMLTIGIGITGLSEALKNVDQGLTNTALATNQSAARLAAKQVSDALVSEVEKIQTIAQSPSLIAEFQKINLDDTLKQLLTRLSLHAINTPETIELESRNNSETFSLIQAPPVLALQNQVHQLYLDDTHNKTFVYSWFALSANGIQLARSPALGSIGHNFAWRSYFHGGPTDWKPTIAGQNVNPPILKSPHISPVFISIYSHHPVITISAPVKDSSGKALGVIAKMLEFGKIIDLPMDQTSQIQFVIIDMRESSSGVILQHPYYQKVIDQNRDQLTHDLFKPEYRIALEEIVKPNPNYFDPIAQLDPAYKGRWLASAVHLNLGKKNSGIYLLAQESHESLIGSSLKSFYLSLVLLLLALIAIILAAIVPFWFWILKKNSKH